MNNMKPYRRHFWPLLGLLLLWAGGTAPTRAADDPFLRMDSRNEVEVDLQQVVADFVPPILDMTAVKSEEEAAWLQGLLDLVGIYGLDRLHGKSNSNLQGGHASATITLQADAEGSLLQRATTMKAGRFHFARYLDRDKIALLTSITNLPETIEVLLDLLTEPRLQEALPVVSEDEDGREVVGGVAIRDDILPLLAGELDLVVFGPQPDAVSPLPDMILVIGAKDGAVLQDQLLEILAEHVGSEFAEMVAALPGEAVGDFTLRTLPMGLAYAVSDNYLVVGTDATHLQELLAHPAGKLKAVEALRYVWLNGDLLAPVLVSLAKQNTAGDEPGDPVQAALLHVLDEGPVGTAEFIMNARPGRMELELDYHGTPLGLQYRIYRAMMAAMPAAVALEAQDGRYTQDVSIIDAAMTLYGVEHDGVFPAHVQDLVTEGYLDEFPDLLPTPLGAYLQGGYSYVPLRGEDGTVIGYYLFVFGMNPHGGYDVFTPENLAAPAQFRIGRDGIPDGVVSFCYDGTAVEQVEEWRGE
jgi:hypothetical protein